MSSNLLTVAKIGRPFGVKGWVHVVSFMEPAAGILQLTSWQLGSDSYKVVAIKPHGHNFVAQLAGIEDRDTAARLRNKLVSVAKEQLPELAADEYYWNDLIGMKVQNIQGAELGVVSHCFATGANDVLAVKSSVAEESFIPFVADHVLDVDSSTGCIKVNWDPGALV